MSVQDRADANFAEEHVVGAVLVEPQSYALPVAALLSPGDFRQPRHRELYAAATEAAEAGRRFDAVSAFHAFPDYRHEIQTAVEIFDLHAEAYKRPLARSIQLVQEAAAVQRMAGALEGLTQEAASVQGVQDAGEWFARIEQALGNTDPRKTHRPDDLPLTKLLLAEIDALEARINDPRAVVGIPSGFSDLDDCTAGWREGQVIVLAARPGVGKSTLGLNMAAHAAHEGHRVAFVSLEMTATECMQRLIASEARIQLRGIITGDFGHDRDTAVLRITRFAEQITTLPLVINYRPGITPGRLRSELRRLKADGGLDLVIVDYLGLMRPDRKCDTRNDEVSQITGALKETAGRLGVPVIALAQLNRDSAKTNRKPILSDLRDSGSIEQDADVVMFLYREKDDNPATDLIVAKQRNGPPGVCKLILRGGIVRFEQAETRH